MTAPAAIVVPGSAAVPDENCRSGEHTSYALRRVLPAVRQTMFSKDLVTSAVRIFERRLGRSVSDSEARMLLARLVDFVRLGVDGSESTPADTRSSNPGQSDRQEWGGGCEPEGR